MGRGLKRAKKRELARSKVNAPRPTSSRRSRTAGSGDILGAQDAAVRRTYRAGGKTPAPVTAARRKTEKPLKWREGRE